MFALGLLLVLVGAALVAAEAHVPSARRTRDRRGRRARGGDRAAASSAAGSAAAGRGRRGCVALAGGASCWCSCARASPRAGSGASEEPGGPLGGRARRDCVFVDGALWRARAWGLEDEPALSPGDPVVVEGVNGLTLTVRPAEEWEVAPMIEAALVAIIVILAVAVAAGGRVGARAARVRAGGGLPARPHDRPKGPGVVLLVPAIDRMVRVSLRTVHAQRPAAGRDHPRQRHRARRRRRLLPRRRPERVGRAGRELPARRPRRSRRRRCGPCSARPTSTRCCPSASSSTRSCRRSSTSRPSRGA